MQNLSVSTSENIEGKWIDHRKSEASTYLLHPEPENL